MTSDRPLPLPEAERHAEMYRSTRLPTRPVPEAVGAGAVGRPHVVVGTDGSSCARVAVRWALAEAVRTGGRLTLVRTWKPGEPVGSPLLGRAVIDHVPDADALVLEMDAEVEDLCRQPDASSTRIDSVVLGGRAEDVLIDESRKADLLVVGRRGRGAFESAVLGSVSSHVAARTHCPVAVVPAEGKGL